MTTQDYVSICHTIAETYHQWPETSCSMLKALRESPIAFYWRHIAKAAPPKSSASLSYGSLLHIWGEVGDASFWEMVQVVPSALCTATGAVSKKADAWKADQDPDDLIVSPSDDKKLRHQTEALLRNQEVRMLLANTEDTEFNIRWKWNNHDVRCRVDGRTDDAVYDWKTCRDENPISTWYKSCLKWGYDMQSAMYQNAQTAIGMPEERMRFIVTSTLWPYENAVVVLPEEVLQQGYTKCMNLLDELQSRKEWDCWERYEAQGVTELAFPAYLLKGDQHATDRWAT